MSTPSKRSRLCNSLSSGDTGVIRQLPPRSPEPSDRRRAVFGNLVKPSPEKSQRERLVPERAHRERPAPEKAHREQLPPAILSLPSPEIVRMEPAAAEVDLFLAECYFCKKIIPQNSDVFMYGPFGAFCSEVCRFKQIYKDRVAEQALGKSTRTAVGSSMKSNVNG